MPGSTLVEADVSSGHPGRGPGRRRAATWPARRRRPTTWPARSRRWPWAARGPATASSSPQRHGARFLLASTSEVYGDPDVHPQSEPTGATSTRSAPAVSTTRPSGSPRRSPWPTTGPAAPTSASSGSSTPTARGSGPTTAGWFQLPRSRPCGASRSPSTATAARPGASATSRTRCAGLLALFDSDLTGRSTSAIPTSTPCSSSPARSSTCSGRRRPSSTGRCRPTTPPGGAPTSPWPGRELGWEPTTASRTGLAARPPTWPRTPGAGRLPVCRRP